MDGTGGISAGSIVADVELRFKNLDEQAKKLQSQLSKKTFVIDKIAFSESAIQGLVKQLQSRLGGAAGGGFAGGAAAALASSSTSAAVSSAVGGAIAARIVGQPTVTAAAPRSYANPFTSNAPTGFNYAAQGRPCPQCGNVNAGAAQFCRKCGFDFRPSFLQRAVGVAQTAGRVLGVAGRTVGMVGHVGKETFDLAWGGVQIGEGIARGVGTTGRMGLAAGGMIANGVGMVGRMMGVGSTPRTLDDVYGQLEAGNVAHLAALQEIRDGLGSLNPTVNVHYPRPRRRKPRGGGGGGGGGGSFSMSGSFGGYGLAAVRRPWKAVEVGGQTYVRRWEQPSNVATGGGGFDPSAGRMPSTTLGAAAMDMLDRLAEQAAFEHDIESAGSGFVDRRLKTRYRGGRGRVRPGSAGTLFSDIVQGGANLWRAGNYHLEMGLLRGHGLLARTFNPSTGRGRNNLLRMGVGLETANFAGDVLQHHNQYNAALGAAVAGGNVQGLIDADVALQDAVGSSIPIPIVGGILGKLGLGIREAFTGDRAKIAASLAGASFNDNKTARLHALMVGGISNRATTASMGPGLANRLEGISLNYDARIAGDTLNFNQSVRADEDRVQTLIASGDTAGAAALQAGLAKSRASFGKQVAGTNRQRALALRSARAEHAATNVASLGSVAVSNLTGIDDRAAGREAIRNQYQPGIVNAVMVGDRMGALRLGAEQAAALGAESRQYAFGTSQMHAGNRVSNLYNLSAAMANGGMEYAGALAAFAAQRAGAGVALRGNLHGVADYGRRAAIVGEYAGQLQGINVAQQGYQREFGFRRSDLAYGVRGAAAGLRGDLYGAQMAGIDAQRARLAQIDPSMRAGASSLLDFQAYEAGAAERSRGIGRGQTLNALYGEGRSLSLAAEGKDIQASMNDAYTQYQNDVNGVMTDPSLTTDAQRQAQLGGLKSRFDGQFKMFQRRIKESQTGGVAVSPGNSINFPGASARSTLPQEDLAEAQRAYDDYVKRSGRDAGVVGGASRSDQQARDALAGGAAGVGGGGGADLGKVVDLLGQAVAAIKEVAPGIGAAIASKLGMQP